MSNVVTSIGAIFSIANESTAGSGRPTTFNKIPKVFENSEFDLDPDTIETTSYDNLKYKSSVAGLIDTTAIQSLSARSTTAEDAETIWNTAVTAYAGGKKCWLCVDIPKQTNAVYIPIIPIHTGVPTIALNDVVNISLKFTIDGDLEFDTKPTSYV